jgi:FKBP-type peptidyl-prolyl cis-trans isomerase FkpA
MHKSLIAAALMLGVYSAAVTAQPALSTDQDKTLYALGIALGGNIQQFALTPEELAVVKAGFDDGVLGNDPKVDMQTYGPLIQVLANERTSAAAALEKEASNAFLESMAEEDDAEQTASGLIYIPMTAGSGESPTAADTVSVHYHGTLRDGTVFDSSVDRGEPISFSLAGVIPCWTEGVQKMQVGGKAKLVCPSDIAYGDAGQGPIPGGATLVFEVELLGIE